MCFVQCAELDEQTLGLFLYLKPEVTGCFGLHPLEWTNNFFSEW